MAQMNNDAQKTRVFYCKLCGRRGNKKLSYCPHCMDGDTIRVFTVEVEGEEESVERDIFSESA